MNAEVSLFISNIKVKVYVRNVKDGGRSVIRVSYNFSFHHWNMHLISTSLITRVREELKLVTVRRLWMKMTSMSIKSSNNIEQKFKIKWVFLLFMLPRASLKSGLWEYRAHLYCCNNKSPFAIVRFWNYG